MKLKFDARLLGQKQRPRERVFAFLTVPVIFTLCAGAMRPLRISVHGSSHVAATQVRTRLVRGFLGMLALDSRRYGAAPRRPNRRRLRST